MEILDQLNACKDENELLDFIENRLAECIREGNKINDGYEVIGEMVDINPKREILLDSHQADESDGYDINIFWNKFIPPNVKIVFGVEYLEGCHNGYYYYMDDFDYLFSFIQGVLGREIYDEIDLISYIHLFLRQYFVDLTEKRNREDYFKLICDSNGQYFEPTIPHSISFFKGKSIAQCTEFGAVAQNIMSFFGLETLYIHDNLHAYNIVEFGGEEKTTSVVDFSKGVYHYNILTKERSYLPFIGDIEECSDELLQELMNTDGRLQFHEYRLYSLGKAVIEQTLEETRSYGSCGHAIEEKKILMK